MADVLKTYGRVRSYIGLAVAVVFTVCVSSSTAFSVNHKTKYTEKTTGTVDDEGNVEITVGDKKYSKKLYVASPPTKGTTVDVYYIKDTPSDMSLTQDVGIPRGLLMGLWCVALIMLLIGGLIAYFSSQSNAFATGYGGVSLVGNVSQALFKQ